MIRIWRFYDAPAKYRELSTNGGDEDWIAVVPADMEDERLVEVFFGGPLLGHDVCNPFGVCDIAKYPCPDEHGTVFIGCHS